LIGAGAGRPANAKTDDESKRRAAVAEVRAEMVANVWKVVVSEGDEVEDGDTLVILESMKMEIPVLAEDDGVISALKVAEGDVIQEGDLIAIIEHINDVE
jgi:biotin carboxyl carrier protein